MILYGLSTCDTCRKAVAALRGAGHEVTLRDVRSAPLGQADIVRFLAAFGDRLVNRASATWRGLSDEARIRPAAVLLAAHPALMKRPVIEAGDRVTLGWDKDSRALWL